MKENKTLDTATYIKGGRYTVTRLAAGRKTGREGLPGRAGDIVFVVLCC